MWLKSHLQADGLLRFDRFMEFALYDSEHGYYHSRLAGIGPGGDFATSATLSDSLALALGAWIRAGQPHHVIEIGAGTGRLARALLRNLGWFGPDLYVLPGRKDLTADVNFDDLVHWGEQLGLQTVAFRTQRAFLLPHLDANKLSATDHFLLDPQGAGSAFKVLVQRKP